MRIPKTIGRRTVLLGSVLALATAGVISTATPAFAAANVLTLNTVGGPSAGGNVVTMTTVDDDTFDPLDATNQHVQFQYRVAGGNVTCAGTYPAEVPIAVNGSGVQTAGIIDVPTANVTVTDLRTLHLTVPSGLVLAGAQTVALYNVCIYEGTGALDEPIADTEGGVGYTISPNKLTLSTYQGPSGGTNTIIATTSGGSFSAGVGVEFRYVGTYCTPKYVASADPDGTIGTVFAPATTVLTPTKVAVTVPILVALAGAGPPTSATYNVCVYNGTTIGTSVLIAGTALPYIIAAAATVTGVTPSSGPAQGGTVITVTGTNLAAGMTVMLGGQLLTNYTLTGTSSFTVAVLPHAASGALSLLVTTQAGAAAILPAAGKTTTFTYTNGIVVAPTTAPNTGLARSWIDVRGVGFADMQFTTTAGMTPDDNKAHVYLARGAYDPKPTVAGGSIKTNPQTLECVDVVPIDDTEVICGLFLAGNQASPVTTRTFSGCSAATTSPTLSAVAGSTTCTFTAADAGMAVTATGIIAAGTTIAVVNSATNVTLSKNPTAAVVTGTSLTLTSTRSIADAVITVAGSAPATVTSAGTPFNAGDVGKAVSSPTYLPTGTVIASVAGGVATLSATALQASTSLAPATVRIFFPYAVSVGTYTITVVNNGTANAQTVLGYSQSIISSGSTYTVADYAF